MDIEQLKLFRQLHSMTPGHPESFATPGVEVCTGPLGQGISNAVGMALAESHLAARYNLPGFNVFDHYTYVLCGDGCMQEGVAAEAVSLAGHLGLHKLILFYDDNEITIDGNTSLSFTEDVGKRFEAYGWNVMSIENGNEADASKFSAAVAKAKAQTAKPTLIKVKTTIGYGGGSYAKEGSEKTHGAPLGDEDIAKVKSTFFPGADASKKFDEFATHKAVKSRY